MCWVALSPPEDHVTPWCWHALQFTPRVAVEQGFVLLDVSASLRLWGGLRALLLRLLQPQGLPACAAWARAGTAPVALALLRLKLAGQPRPGQVPDGLPLDTLAAAWPALAVLERTGCRSWGQLRALPRAGVARRFGAALLEALDQAYGLRPTSYPWCRLPPVFDQNVELPATATAASELLWTGQRLLAALHAWLRAGQRGVLAMELQWTHDLRRLDGRTLARQGLLTVRTAQPTQDMAHLRRLLAEHLERTPLAAPANHLRLRTLETAAYAPLSTSLLPEEHKRGERLHELVERLGARLGVDRVLVPQLVADHRPECMQRWVPAQASQGASTPPAQALAPDAALYPAWLLREPLPLAMEDGQPVFHGPLRLLARPRRVDGPGWWDLAAPQPAVRDYRLALSAQLGLLWLYCERPHSGQPDPRWFLQGVYA
ncbi:DNA polymerase Y family protein [Pseudorhodoferax soli]|uniref:Protein ImuB n=1 Tax=Pseudorhodoferax soli TaxID=545864 RepID=A0A368XQI4_9BURK|nr:DNA polymerase Y family protein [Pseudorhodoferax soli]RCW69288.1 protein ImuB [Pseudorhodoferax soli]